MRSMGIRLEQATWFRLYPEKLRSLYDWKRPDIKTEWDMKVYTMKRWFVL